MSRVYVVIRENELTDETTVEGVWGRYDDALNYTIDNTRYGVVFFIEEQRVR